MVHAWTNAERRRLAYLREELSKAKDAAPKREPSADGNRSDRSGVDATGNLYTSRRHHARPLSRGMGEDRRPCGMYVGLFVIVLTCPKVVRLYRTYLRFRTVV
jgi:hypothetical protein